MSDDFQNDDNEQDAGGLRKQLSELGKKLKAAEEQNVELSKQVRATSVEKLFGSAKADLRGVKFYNGEATKEAVEAWLKGDGEPFAKAPEQQTQEQTQDESQPEGNSVTLVNQETLEAARQAARMQPTPVTPQGLDDLADKVGRSSMKGDDDVKDLEKLWDGIRQQAAAAYQQRGY